MPSSQEKPSDFEQIVCPVCKRVLHPDDVPDMARVIEENLYYTGGVLIVDSEVRIQCEFMHRLDEEGNFLDDPHGLIAIIVTLFDGIGKCTSFEIVEVIDQEKGGD
ncbi:MAG: hypothetical protein PVF58_11010 [Candidatus Methanofastidiosia archaeon]|jgi:hypothetical protein